jgi:hypothetical protein
VRRERRERGALRVAREREAPEARAGERLGVERGADPGPRGVEGR